MQSMREKSIDEEKFTLTDSLVRLGLVVPSLFRDGITKMLKFEKNIEIVAYASTHGEITYLLEREKPDVLLIDTAIPDIDVLKVLEIIRQKSPETNLLLLVHTLNEESFINTISLGVRGYLTETSDTEELIEAVKAADKEEIWAERRIITKVLTQILPFRMGTLYRKYT